MVKVVRSPKTSPRSQFANTQPRANASELYLPKPTGFISRTFANTLRPQRFAKR
jgi:hypothetical protein